MKRCTVQLQCTLQVHRTLNCARLVHTVCALTGALCRCTYLSTVNDQCTFNVQCAFQLHSTVQLGVFIYFMYTLHWAVQKQCTLQECSQGPSVCGLKKLIELTVVRFACSMHCRSSHQCYVNVQCTMKEQSTGNVHVHFQLLVLNVVRWKGTVECT